MNQKILCLKDYKRLTWNNPVGYSDEIARNEESTDLYEFNWRIAIDDIVQDGPFTVFPGYTRIMSVLEGSNMQVVFNGVYENIIQTYDYVRCEGEMLGVGTLLSGPIRDLNLLYNNERYTGHFQWLQLSEVRDFTSDAEVIAIFSAIPTLTAIVNNSPETLKLHDTLLITQNVTQQAFTVKSPLSLPSDYCCVVELFKHLEHE